MQSITHFPTINQDAVKVQDRRSDRSVTHRAIVIARELCRAGIWNGQDTITIYDPAVTFNKVFGFAAHPITSLRSGVDYQIEPAVIPYSRPELPVTEDGDILFV